MNNEYVMAAGCLLYHDGEYLLFQRAPGRSQAGMWGMPGGKIDPGESAKEAAIRETHEETGIALDPKAVNLVIEVWHEFSEDDKVNFSIFAAELGRRPVPVTDEREFAQSAWLSYEDIMQRSDEMIALLVENITRYEQQKGRR